MVNPRIILEDVAENIRQVDGFMALMSEVQVFDIEVRDQPRNYREALDQLDIGSALLVHRGVRLYDRGGTQWGHELVLYFRVNSLGQAYDAVAALMAGTPGADTVLAFEDNVLSEHCEPMEEMSFEIDALQEGIDIPFLRFVLVERGV